MIDSVILENKRRNALLATPYDPVTGVGAGGERREMLSPDGHIGTCAGHDGRRPAVCSRARLLPGVEAASHPSRL